MGKVASVSDEAARNGKHKPRPPYDPLCVRGSQASLRGRPKNMVKMGPGDPPLGAPRPRDRPARLACMHTYVFIKAICLYLRLCSAQGRAQESKQASKHRILVKQASKQAYESSPASSKQNPSRRFPFADFLFLPPWLTSQHAFESTSLRGLPKTPSSF